MELLFEIGLIALIFVGTVFMLLGIAFICALIMLVYKIKKSVERVQGKLESLFDISQYVKVLSSILGGKKDNG